jgi:hypothetical protein
LSEVIGPQGRKDREALLVAANGMRPVRNSPAQHHEHSTKPRSEITAVVPHIHNRWAGKKKNSFWFVFYIE